MICGRVKYFQKREGGGNKIFFSKKIHRGNSVKNFSHKREKLN